MGTVLISYLSTNVMVSMNACACNILHGCSARHIPNRLGYRHHSLLHATHLQICTCAPQYRVSYVLIATANVARTASRSLQSYHVRILSWKSGQRKCVKNSGRIRQLLVMWPRPGMHAQLAGATITKFATNVFQSISVCRLKGP